MLSLSKLNMIGLPDQYNLTTHFVDRHIAEGRGDKTAIVCGDMKITFDQIASDVNRVGNGLRELGIQEEQRVLLLLPDCPEFVAAYFGSIKIGAVPVPTNTTLHSSDYAYFLDESRARILIVHSSLYSRVEPAFSQRKYLRHVIVVGEPQPDRLAWGEWVAASSPELRAAQTNKDDVAFWLWTSGSTGLPKAAVHLQHDWHYCCEYYARGVLDISEDDVTFSSSKLFHAYGLGNALLFPFHVGATTVLHPDRPKASAILQIAQETRPTLFFSVPTLYAAMLQETDHNNPYDLHSVRLAVSAAEPLPGDIFRRWKERFGTEILDGIGSTEVLHIYLSARPGKVKPGSTGQPVPGYEIRIIDEAERDLPPDETGDLIVRGESTAPYYWNRRKLSAERMRGQWFFSGDKYWRDADGYFWYAGRSDDMFRVSGQWVSPIEVENALIEHSAVLEAAVVPYEEETSLHTAKAFVVLKQGAVGSEALIRELQEFVKMRIAPHKSPRRIEFCDELPKTAAGKLLRYLLRGANPSAAG
jgi:benzoate-CoA ligase family protein